MMQRVRFWVWVAAAGVALSAAPVVGQDRGVQAQNQPASEAAPAGRREKVKLTEMSSET